MPVTILRNGSDGEWARIYNLQPMVREAALISNVFGTTLMINSF